MIFTVKNFSDHPQSNRMQLQVYLFDYRGNPENSINRGANFEATTTRLTSCGSAHGLVGVALSGV
jgi:hypothetical protein